MNKLPLIFKGSDWLYNYQGTKDFYRMYNTIKVSRCVKWDNNALKVFNKYGPDLKSLELFKCDFYGKDDQVLNGILESLNKLEELITPDIHIKTFKPHFIPRFNSVALNPESNAVNRNPLLIN